MRKFCKFCQEPTDHFGDECLDCFELIDEEDEDEDELTSVHDSGIEFINDDSESDNESENDDNESLYESESEGESDMEY